MRRNVKLALAIMVIGIGIGLASGQVQQAIMQVFPGIKVPPVPVKSHSNGEIFLTSNCGNPATLVNGTNPLPGNRTIFFSCGAAGLGGSIAAFNVYNTNGSFTGAGTFIPTFTLPNGYTQLSYTAAGDIACTNTIAALTSGTLVTIQIYSYSYCATYQNVYNETLASFSITWN